MNKVAAVYVSDELENFRNAGLCALHGIICHFSPESAELSCRQRQHPRQRNRVDAFKEEKLFTFICHSGEKYTELSWYFPSDIDFAVFFPAKRRMHSATVAHTDCCGQLPRKDVIFLSKKQANTCIRCRVDSCSYHCDSENYCSLSAIQVDPCANCHTGEAAGESMCASYKQK